MTKRKGDLVAASCEVCGSLFERAETGRPRLYCSDRCKEKNKRKVNRERDRAAVAGLASVPVDEGGPAYCHVCAQQPATVGTPEPLLCQGCARPG